MKLIKNAWYPILDSHSLKRHGIKHRLNRFQIPMVLWRTRDGEIACLEDRCAHKAAPLGLGKISDDCIVCPYHGLEFNPQGECVHVPALGRFVPPPGNLRVRKFSVREAYGFLWMWWGDGLPARDIPFFPELESRKKHVKAYSCKYPASFHRVMESNSDGYHIDHLHARVSPRVGPIIHEQRSKVRGRFIEITTRFKREPNSEKIVDAVNTILFPHSAMAFVPHMNMRNIIACCPIDEESTWFMIRFYAWPFELPFVGRVLTGLLNLFSHYFIAPADFAVQSWQYPKETGLGTDKPLPGADAGVVEYWKMLRAELAIAEPTPSALANTGDLRQIDTMQ